jgi:hypothetical protein
LLPLNGSDIPYLLFTTSLGRPVTLNETAAFARVLGGIEEETNPNLVGGKVRGVEIFPNGRARDMTETDIGCQTKVKTGGKAKNQRNQ